MRDFKMLHVRLNELESKAIDQMAKEQQITVSELLRNMMKCAMDKRRREREGGRSLDN